MDRREADAQAKEIVKMTIEEKISQLKFLTSDEG